MRYTNRRIIYTSEVWTLSDGQNVGIRVLMPKEEDLEVEDKYLSADSKYSQHEDFPQR